MKITLPQTVQTIIGVLESNGYEAYAVGGCVRDSLLGFAPKDWDICTSARPEQVMASFRGQRIVETGLQHGTVTLILKHQPYEITTYRIDGAYSDNRHPDTVEFTASLAKDLARRDFTVNAMAYNPQNGLADFFGGMNDLMEGIIRCAGDPDKRFQEDALRILRAMRFASVLGFAVEKHTKAAMLCNKNLLHSIAPERIAGELSKLIVGDGACDVLSQHLPILLEVIPELTPGFEEYNRKNSHPNLQSIGYAPKAVIPRFALLFCALTRPSDGIQTGEGNRQFSVGAEEGAALAKEILLRLRYDKNTIESVTRLVRFSDMKIVPNRTDIKRQLNRMGADTFRELLAVKRADAMAQSEPQRRLELLPLGEAGLLLEEIIAERQCYSLKDLAVNGRDLLECGLPEGAEIGEILAHLLTLVMEEKAENIKEVLLPIAAEMMKTAQSE